jgi:eukaryotic-like serine/threonine-protein kinase
MTISSVTNLIDALRQGQLLQQPQLDQLSASLQGFAQPRALAQDLLQRGWLTPYQLNQVFPGRANELLLGPYLLLERIGEGAVGQVFKARHQHMQRVVALKLIRKEVLADAEIVGRFYREIHAISQLIHPNVIMAYDAGPAGQTHFFAMEYVEGIDLVRLVKQQGRLKVEQACDFIKQASLGLQHIHERGLVHRDIKPSNLLVAQTQKDNPAGQIPATPALPWGLLKVLDLGLARLQQPTNGVSPLTQAGGGLRGTADYLAPEQAVDFHRADIRADIYSLGCTLFFLLTGQPPYEGGTLAQKLMAHQRGDPPSLDKLRRGLPRKVLAIVRKMMAKRPEDRFQTPADAAEALANVHRRTWLPRWGF